jgi:hypothetical protein
MRYAIESACVLSKENDDPCVLAQLVMRGVSGLN